MICDEKYMGNQLITQNRDLHLRVANTEMIAEINPRLESKVYS